MAGEESTGVVFPVGDDGRRSTAAVGRAVVAEALRPVDPVGALAAEQETNWRAGYLVHFRRLVEAGLASREAALTIAGSGLASLHHRMRVVGPDGDEVGLEWLRSAAPAQPFGTVEVAGGGTREEEFTLPYAGGRLRGDDLRRRLDAWVTAGVMEPSAADAIRQVVAHPEWLGVPDATVAVLGAGAEMGPLTSLLRWGARVAAIDLPRPALWQRVLETARRGAGTLVVPVPHGEPEGKADLAHVAGADLITEVPAVAEWLGALDRRLVVGNYVYADGATNVRVSTAVDALTVRLLAERADVALAFLATPTDVFAVPAEAVQHSARAYAGRSTVAKVIGRPLRTLSAGRLLRRAYVPGAAPGISDSLVAQQGPNYALAKRLQRWRATVAREAGTTVSMNVAPPTRTRSVVKNRALAAAYAGAHRFGVQVFEPATANVLMAALLVHDLHITGNAVHDLHSSGNTVHDLHSSGNTVHDLHSSGNTAHDLHTDGGPRHDHPWQDEAFAAVHGGLWRTPYAPRSALGLAALLGYGAARG